MSFRYCQLLLWERNIYVGMHPSPEKLVEVGMIVAGVIGIAGLLVLIAPNFGLKPKPTVDGWRFPVKPTCLLLYYLGLAGGMGAVAFGADLLLTFGTANGLGWTAFGFGFLLVPLVLADWPEPLILDGHGLLEGRSPSSRIFWQELKDVRAYRIRCDRGVVIHGVGGKRLVVADIAYDSEAVRDYLLQLMPVPYYSLEDEMAPLSLFTDHQS
jgi:hypothetical protein